MMKKKTCKDYVLAVANDVCNENPLPKKNDYVKKIVELKSYDDYQNTQIYKPEDIRSGISRAIDSLVDSKEFVCLKGKYFAPNSGKYKQDNYNEIYYNFLKDKIRVLKRDTLIISHNMCAIIAEPIENTSGNNTESTDDTSKESKIVSILKKCLGENCFHVLKNKKFLYIMVKCPSLAVFLPDTNSEEFYIIKAIQYSVSKIYDQQKAQESEDTKPLLDYDTKKEQLEGVLADGYRYYYWVQNVTNNNDKTEDRIFFIIECAPDVTNKLYTVIANCFSDLFDSMYCGFGGICLVFSQKNDLKTFVKYIK